MSSSSFFFWIINILWIFMNNNSYPVFSPFFLFTFLYFFLYFCFNCYWMNHNDLPYWRYDHQNALGKESYLKLLVWILPSLEYSPLSPAQIHFFVAKQSIFFTFLAILFASSLFYWNFLNINKLFKNLSVLHFDFRFFSFQDLNINLHLFFT